METNTKSTTRNYFITQIEQTRKLNYSEKRLILDLEELEEKVDPTIGISAAPIQQNLFKWHANITGPEGTPYEGVILHLDITYPKDYPNNGPQITQVTKFSSPFFQGGRFVSEIISQDWCSGYSTFSILMQIQCCLFEINPGQQGKIEKEMLAIQKFKCPDCEHDLSQNKIWPPFVCILEDGPKTFAKLTEDERLVEECFCFHTRLNVKQTILGAGVAFNRLARTKQINTIYTTVDLVSMKAFKEGLRKALNKKRFSHWVPLFFGDSVTNKEKTLDHFRRSLSLLVTNRPDRFDESLILKTMPYMMLTHALQVLQDKEYSSIKGLRMFLSFHRAFLFLLETHPNVKQEMETKIKKFIEDEDFRHKNFTPDLGVLMTFLSVSEVYSIEQVKQSLIFESLDRKVLWTSKKVPQLLNIENQALDENRAKQSFEANLQSFQLMLFFYFFTSQLLERNQSQKDINEIKAEYDKRYCRLDPKIEESLQSEVKLIQNVKTFEGFFNRMGFPAMKIDKLNQVLKQAVKNSLQKNYHGGIENAFPLPDAKDRVLEVIKEEGLLNYNQEESKNDFSFRDILFNRYSVAHQCIANNNKLSPGQLSYLIDLQRNSGIDLNNYLLDRNNEILSDPYIESYQQLVTKLDTEYSLFLNQFCPDQVIFFYNVLPKIKENPVHSLNLSLKVLSYNKNIVREIQNIKSLTIRVSSESENECNVLRNLMMEGSDLALIELNLINTEASYHIKLNEHLIEFIKSQGQSLNRLTINNFSIGGAEALAILNIKLSNLTSIRLINCQAPINTAKSIAEIIRINNNAIKTIELKNNLLGENTKFILQVLKDCPNLEYLNLENIDLNEIKNLEYEDLMAQIIKFTKIHTLNLANTNKAFPQGAFEMAKMSKTLVRLNLQNTQNFPGYEDLLGQLIQEKSAEKVPIKNLQVSKIDISSLQKACQEQVLITQTEESKVENSFEVNQGFTLTLKDITESNYDKNIQYGLFHDLQNLIITHTSNRILSLLRIFGQYKNFKMLEISHSKLPKQENYRARLISKICTQQRQLLNLNLSNLSLGVGESLQIKEFLKNSSTIQHLNLYGNKFGVEGAINISEGLKENSSLVSFDIGFNRIRNKGARAVAQAVLGQESQSKLEQLSMKNNFINEKGFKDFVTLIVDKCGPLADINQFSLKALFISGNDISLFELKHLSKVVNDRKVLLYVDSFERIKRNEDNVLFLSEINPKTINEDKLVSRLQKNIKNVIVKDIKIGKGQKTRKTKQGQSNNFLFVTFDNQNAIPQALKIDRQLTN